MQQFTAFLFYSSKMEMCSDTSRKILLFLCLVMKFRQNLLFCETILIVVKMLRSNMVNNSLWLFFSAAFLFISKIETTPENPCPSVFSYITNRGQMVYGQAIIPYDGSNQLAFSINVSFRGLFQSGKIKIALLNPPKANDLPEKLRYDILFPFPKVVPKITQITFNSKIYCTGPPEKLTPGNGVTNLWAAHFYEFYGGQYVPQPQETHNPGHSTENSLSSEASTWSVSKNEENDSITNIIQSIFTSPKTTNVHDILTSTKQSENLQCGVSSLVVPLVLGGTEVMEDQFPWLCAMFAYNYSANSYDYKCTANLISTKHVITAAGCLQYYKVQLIATEDILVVLGNNDLSHWATNGAVSRSASKVLVHPEFTKNPNSANADIALIELSEPIAFTKSIRPICLWEFEDDSLDNFVNKQGLLAGWGKDEITSGLNIFRAKYVQIPIVSQIECLRSNPLMADITSENTFCAGDLNGKGPCIGDTGAGFLISQNGVYHLRGITSRTITKNGVCTLNRDYTVYCDVAKYMPWIRNLMNK